MRLHIKVCALVLLVAHASAMAQTSVRAGYEERERKLMADILKRPDDAKLYNELGVTQFYLGKSAQAEASFLKSIQLDPSNVDARANLSFHYFQTRRQEAAVDLVKEALTIDPDNFLANHYAGLLYFARNQPTRAELLLRKALSLQPGNLDVRLDLIKVHAATGQAVEAEREMDRMAGEHPSDARVRYARAAFYASQGRHLDAINEYKTVLVIAPESSGVRLEMAVLYFRAKDFYNALAMLEEFHKTGVSVESAYLLGHALAETGKLDRAEEWLKKSIEGRESFFDSRFQLGRLYFTKRRYAEAIEQLRRAVELQNQNVETRYLLGFCLELTNEAEAAMAEYEEILRLAPDRFEGHHGAGSVHLKRGDVTKAVAHLFKAAGFNPRDPDVQFLLGRALSQAGNNSGAIDHLKTAVALDPNRVDARYQLATALRKAGRAQEADEQFKIAERLNAEFRNRGADVIKK